VSETAVTTASHSRAWLPRTASSARTAVTIVFVVHGVLFASWTAHVPQVKAALHLTDSELGLALLGAPVGSVSAMLIAGAVLTRTGSRPVVRHSAPGYCLAGVLVGLARSLPELFAALAVWGLFQGALDVAMNTQGVTVEKALQRPIMSTLHGGWSLGTLAGAGIGVLAVATGTPLSIQLLILGVPAVAATTWAAVRLLDEPSAGLHQQTRRRPTPLLLIMGAIAFAGLLCEGATADWAAVYLRDCLHTLPAIAGLGYTGYTLAMVTVRFTGARLFNLLRPRLLVCALAAVATIGMAAGLLIGNPAVAIIGFGLLGIGLGSIIPTLFSAAGNQPNLAPGAAVATVSSIGWAGFMCGPPLIGFIAGHSSLPLALGLFPVLTGFIAVASWRANTLDKAQSTRTP
jgi:MFS family permease